MDVWDGFGGYSHMSLGTVRHMNYRDYEQFPYGTLEQGGSPPKLKDPYSKVQEKCLQIKIEKAQKKECPFCKEHKKRPLIDYLRKREIRKKNESICEDEEEEAEEAREDQHTH